MSRLINADMLKLEYENGTGITEEEKQFAYALIDAQPTAYDPDKVAAQLEIEKRTANNTYIAYEMKVDLGRVFGLEKAIEIVKGGGR